MTKVVAVKAWSSTHRTAGSFIADHSSPERHLCLPPWTRSACHGLFSRQITSLTSPALLLIEASPCQRPRCGRARIPSTACAFRGRGCEGGIAARPCGLPDGAACESLIPDHCHAEALTPRCRGFASSDQAKTGFAQQRLLCSAQKGTDAQLTRHRPTECPGTSRPDSIPGSRRSGIRVRWSRSSLLARALPGSGLDCGVATLSAPSSQKARARHAAPSDAEERVGRIWPSRHNSVSARRISHQRRSIRCAAQPHKHTQPPQQVEGTWHGCACGFAAAGAFRCRAGNDRIRRVD